jgi:hypothetical protein
VNPAYAARPAQPAVLIMAKAPRPGTVKTRLHPMLGPDGCAVLARQLIHHAASVAARAGGVTVLVAVDPPDALGEVGPLLPTIIDLGSRGSRITVSEVR